MVRNSILFGDCEDLMLQIPDNFVDLTFTSPPYYNARDYVNYPTYLDYLNKMDRVFKRVHKITNTGRFLVVNISPVIEARKSRNSMSKRYAIPFDLHTILIKQGWDFIEDIIWQKPEYAAKNRNGGFFQNRNPLTYKPNIVTEYILVYRKSTDKLIDWNLKQTSKENLIASKVIGEYDRTNVWNISPAKSKLHPAVFPDILVGKVIKYYSMVGDLIFDPFAGIGTTGRVASTMKRDFLLCEQNENYFNTLKKLTTINEP